jgi:sirohydrochlorin cobaltochelatase
MRAEVASRLAGCKVALSFLEFSAPNMADAARELRDAGAKNVLIVPVFLSGGGHVANDIPALVAAQRKQYPEMTFDVSGALGEEPEVAAGMVTAIGRLSTRSS